MGKVLRSLGPRRADRGGVPGGGVRDRRHGDVHRAWRSASARARATRRISIDDYLDKAKAARRAHGRHAQRHRHRRSRSTARSSRPCWTRRWRSSTARSASSRRSRSSAGRGAKLLEAAEAGAAKMGTAGLSEALGAADHVAKVAAIEKSLAEAGIDATVKASGKTAEELATLVGKESESGKRLLAAAGLGKDAAALEGLTTKLADFAQARTGRAGDGDALRRSTSSATRARCGAAGGWKTVTKTLGEGHPIAAELDAWRGGLVRDMQAWMEAASKGESKAVQTGTVGRDERRRHLHRRHRRRAAGRSRARVPRPARGRAPRRAGDDPRPRRRRQPRAHAPAGRREGPDAAGARRDRARGRALRGGR